MFLMSYWAQNRSSARGAEALQMALHTLRNMALGGIHDHVAQVGNLPGTTPNDSSTCYGSHNVAEFLIFLMYHLY